MTIGLVTVGCNSPQNLRTMVESAQASLEGTDHNLTVMIADHGGVAETIDNLVTEALDHPYCRVINLLTSWPNTMTPRQRQRAGIGASWNTGIEYLYRNGHDAVIVSNDDIVFQKGDLEILATETAKHSEDDVYLVVASGIQLRPVPPHRDSIGYSCFGITKAGWRTLGCFDQSFFPAYYEDNDYTYRSSLAGMREVGVETQIVHIGSQTIYNDPELELQNQRTQNANRLYYTRKWGGIAGEEKYSAPFGGKWGVIAKGEELFRPYYIDPSKRDAPYGVPFDRTGPERAALVYLP